MIKALFRLAGPLIVIHLLIFTTVACKKHYVPKPRGYFRIDLPEKSYIKYQSDCPYGFEIPSYSKIVKDLSPNSEPCWINIEMPGLNGKIHLSYKEIHGNLGELIEDARTLVYKHTTKADAIDETLMERKEDKVYCILYDIKGNAASSVQFFITDSVQHFLRGALYFQAETRADSLEPVIAFIREDVVQLINTINWK